MLLCVSICVHSLCIKLKTRTKHEIESGIVKTLEKTMYTLQYHILHLPMFKIVRH